MSEANWKLWGPYLSERQWGTVREDYSASGNAWEYFPHDDARRRAYRWGEDGLAGLSDQRQKLCFALALWNGQDPILKERLFGLTNSEGNHGEDVKELYYYLDATPTHSYLKMLYKYPQRAYPYQQLVEENRRRTTADPEFELLDTGVFHEDRYFDVLPFTSAMIEGHVSHYLSHPSPEIGAGPKRTEFLKSDNRCFLHNIISIRAVKHDAGSQHPERRMSRAELRLKIHHEMSWMIGQWGHPNHAAPRHHPTTQHHRRVARADCLS